MQIRAEKQLSRSRSVTVLVLRLFMLKSHPQCLVFPKKLTHSLLEHSALPQPMVCASLLGRQCFNCRRSDCIKLSILTILKRTPSLSPRPNISQ